MKLITMKDLPKQSGPVTIFEWVEQQALYKGVPLEKLPIDDEVKEFFEGYIREKEEEMEERLKGW